MQEPHFQGTCGSLRHPALVQFPAPYSWKDLGPARALHYRVQHKSVRLQLELAYQCILAEGRTGLQQSHIQGQAQDLYTECLAHCKGRSRCTHSRPGCQKPYTCNGHPVLGLFLQLAVPPHGCRAHAWHQMVRNISCPLHKHLQQRTCAHLRGSLQFPPRHLPPDRCVRHASLRMELSRYHHLRQALHQLCISETHPAQDRSPKHHCLRDRRRDI
mmetsp:Transcript_10828/g.19246  ORF Transcript_10828/g.19246 Transcript_10828/m.19246 type:complete len:215 (+) Transcript_10828:399-1043(+)